MSVSKYAEQFPWDKVDAAKRYLYMVKPWWARFGQKLKIVPVYQRPPEGKPYGSITSTDGGFRLYIDVGFASWAPLHILAGAIEHEFQHHTRDSWNRLQWLTLDEWNEWANIVFDLEINGGIEYESSLMTMENIRALAEKSNVFVDYELDFWSVSAPPGIGEEGWLPRLIGLPDRLSAEEYLKILQMAKKEPPPPPLSDESSEDSDNEGDEDEDQQTSDAPDDDSSLTEDESPVESDDDQESEEPQESEPSDDESTDDDENHQDDDQEESDEDTEGDADSSDDAESDSEEGSDSDADSDEQQSDDAGNDSSGDGSEDSDESSEDSDPSEGNGDSPSDGSSESSSDASNSPQQSSEQASASPSDKPSTQQEPLTDLQQLAETFNALKGTGDRRMWSAELDNPKDELTSPAWKPEDRKNEKPLDRASIEGAMIELEEDVIACGASSVFGLHPGANMLQWAAKRRRVRGVDWQSRLNRLLSSSYTSAKVHGASDLSYTVRNPNQPEFGVILQGLHDYAPKIVVIQDVSGSMLINDGMNKAMSAFTDLCTKVLGRFNSPVTWVTVDAGIIDVGSASSWTKHQQKRWSYGYGGTEIAPAIEQVMTGKLVWKGKKYPKADLTIISTDCIFEWPKTRPIRNGKLLVVSVESDYKKINKFLPAWLDRKRELIIIED